MKWKIVMIMIIYLHSRVHETLYPNWLIDPSVYGLSVGRYVLNFPCLYESVALVTLYLAIGKKLDSFYIQSEQDRLKFGL